MKENKRKKVGRERTLAPSTKETYAGEKRAEYEQ